MGIQRLGLNLLQKGLMAEEAGIRVKRTSDVSKKSIMGLDEAETKLDKYLDFWG